MAGEICGHVIQVADVTYVTSIDINLNTPQHMVNVLCNEDTFPDIPNRHLNKPIYEAPSVNHAIFVNCMIYWSVLMMTSSNGNFFRVTVSLCGEFTGPGEFPAQRPVTRSFDVFFDLRLNKRLRKQPWSETPSWPLWRQCNVKSQCNVEKFSNT